eukprot:CAMPEP_0185182964 /NCGR_PEP_ID=MMETSP1140-20130426/1674_1 /TAXON_ID=298111 /ORGANISM="Pavlova sp., Strain CCMP459" /LENGTH=381 /DNA_ID=CAMNT_0027748937 /DNA_START=18 /DNA_END=1163 /DNA_ORIENTATION=+
MAGFACFDLEQLRLITDLVDEDDAICVALTCSSFRDAILARFPRREDGGPRWRTCARSHATSLKRVRWALDVAGCPMYDALPRWVAEHGHVDALESIVSLLDAVEDASLCTAAAWGGSLEALQWLRSRGHAWDADTVRAACEGGHEDFLRWVLDNGCPRDELACHWTAAQGSIAVMEILRARGFSWYNRTPAVAARHGHLDMLIYLRDHGCPWDARVCAWAAANGHMHVLNWAVEHGALLDASAVTMAARHGRLDMIARLHELGCPMTGDACMAASGLEDERVLRLLRAQGCPYDRSACLDLAAERDESGPVAAYIEANLPPDDINDLALAMSFNSNCRGSGRSDPGAASPMQFNAGSGLRCEDTMPPLSGPSHQVVTGLG